MNTAGHVVKEIVARRYAQRQNELCDGQDPEEILCEVIKVLGGWSVMNYQWNIAEQRRIYLNTCNIPVGWYEKNFS